MIKSIAIPVASLSVGLVLAGALMQKRVAAVALDAFPQAAEKQDHSPAMRKPGPEMDRLKFLIGTWDFDGEYAKSPMVPQGGKETGWYKARMGPGGFSIVTDFEADGPIGKEIGHQVLTWDPKENTYKFYTAGNSFPGVIVTTARWEGANLVTSGEFSEGGTKISLRSIYMDIQEKSVTIEEWYRAGDTPDQLLIRTKATRK